MTSAAERRIPTVRANSRPEPHKGEAAAARVAEIVGVHFATDHSRHCRAKLGAAWTPGALAVLRRLGLTPTDFGRRNDAAVGLDLHAKEICTRAPRCGVCPLVSFCELGQSRLRSTRKIQPTVVDLFAGAGGMGLGFHDAGFRVALAIETDRDAAQTYRLNHPGVPVLELDMRNVGAKSVLAVVGARPDVVCAGPPCQSYSMAGRRLNRDPRHRLYRHVLKVADELKPRVVLIENVPGVSRIVGRRSYIDVIQHELEMHYATEVRLLDASEYGVPQLRRRYFFFGRRRGTREIGTPPPTHSLRLKPGHRVTPTVMKELAALPRRLHGSRNDVHKVRGKVKIRNLATMLHSKRVIARIKRIRAGEGPLSYRRIPRDYAQTIVAGHRALPVHPTAHRAISVREAARLQGFPNGYAFLGPRANQPLQVANAVPPPLARAIARQIRIHLERHGRRP